MTIRMETTRGMIIQKIRTCAGQKYAAAIYAAAMAEGHLRDGEEFWGPINATITERWKRGLTSVKRLAWRIYEGKEAYPE